MKIDTSNIRAGRGGGVRRLVILGVALMVAVPAGWAGDVADGLIDPTRPWSGGASAAVERSPGSLLQSTYVSASQRRAVIGGRSYSVGDKFGGAVITDIQPYEVILKRAGRETHLRLLPKLAKEILVVKEPAHDQEDGQKEGGQK